MKDWDQELPEQARALRNRLDRGHPAPPTRRRIRPLRAAALLVLLAGAAATALWLRPPADPVAAIESHYRDQARLRELLKTEGWDPDTRRQFETTLGEVDKALRLAQEALRRSPDNEDFRELCHIAYRAKSHLFVAYRQVQGD